jgi:arsenite-transporting ATPase
MGSNRSQSGIRFTLKFYLLEILLRIKVSQGLPTDGLESGVGSIMKDLMTSVPGIDEAMAFAELMKMVQEMNYSTIVFDTAPTGHTLRLLSFPKTMESAIGKLLDLKVSINLHFCPLSLSFVSIIGIKQIIEQIFGCIG